MTGYSYKPKEDDAVAKAIGRELHISPKHSVEICSAIRGKKLEDAKDFLEGVIDLKNAVPFKRYHRRIAHRKGQGFGPGRFPQKAAGAILKLLENAESNAEYSGLDPEMLVVRHISANRGRILQGWMPRARGRSSPSNTETVNVEVILEEVEA